MAQSSPQDVNTRITQSHTAEKWKRRKGVKREKGKKCSGR